mmetsp:Transcript_15564/g.31243  ORF Transcript_15564/g.31243 Transcript_15564/m.31243 type:complete len:314 (+) Transcript_15564:66-1007(+)
MSLQLTAQNDNPGHLGGMARDSLSEPQSQFCTMADPFNNCRTERACRTNVNQARDGDAIVQILSQQLQDPPGLVVDQILGCGGELGVALDDLVDRLDHVLLGHSLAASANGVHARFDADGTDVGAGGIRAEAREQLEADVALTIHRARVDLEDARTTLKVWQPKLDLAVEAARAKQRRVERVWPVGRHQNLDVAARIEAVQLIDDFEHRPLYLIVAARAVVEARAANRIDLIDEDDARLLAPRHLEELAHHARALADVLLDKLGADDANEASIRPVGDRARSKRLAGAGRPVEQDALWRINAKLDESLRVQHR